MVWDGPGPEWLSWTRTAIPYGLNGPEKFYVPYSVLGFQSDMVDGPNLMVHLVLKECCTRHANLSLLRSTTDLETVVRGSKAPGERLPRGLNAAPLWVVFKYSP